MTLPRMHQHFRPGYLGRHRNSHASLHWLYEKHMQHHGFIEIRKSLWLTARRPLLIFIYLFFLCFYVLFCLGKKHSMGAAAAANTTRSICLSRIVHKTYKERPSLPKHTGVPESQAVIGHNEFHYCFWNSIRAFVCTHLSVKRWYYSAWQLDTCTKNKKRSPWGRKMQGREDASWLFFAFRNKFLLSRGLYAEGKNNQRLWDLKKM